MSSAQCLSPQASGHAACRRRAADGHAPAIAHPPPLPPRASSPRPSAASAAAVADPHHPPRAIILHPRHAYRLPRPLPVVVVAAASPFRQTQQQHRRPPPPPNNLLPSLPLDALGAIAARLGDGRALAAFAATCRACKEAAYDERLWRRECERRFGPIMPPPAAADRNGREKQQQAAAPPLSWRRLYAFNAAAYEAVVAATREAERARAMSRLLGASVARRWAAGRVAFAH